VDTGGSGALHVANMQLQLIIIIIIIISEIFVTRLLQLKNEHKRDICCGKIYKNRLKTKVTVARPNKHYMLD